MYRPWTSYPASLQQQRRDRGIDAAGHADDDRPGGAGVAEGKGIRRL